MTFSWLRLDKSSSADRRDVCSVEHRLLVVQISIRQTITAIIAEPEDQTPREDNINRRWMYCFDCWLFYWGDY